MKPSVDRHIIRMRRGMFIASLITLSGCASLSEPKVIDDILFSDKNFALCFSGVESYSPAAVTEIDCSDSNITSVDELKYFPNLKHLVLLNNQIAHLNTRNNPKLERIVVAGNDLTDIDVSHNPELKMLNVSKNQLTQLDVSRNPLLESLYAYKMPIAELDVSHLDKLRDLGLSMHKLNELDVTHNPNLSSLNLTSGSLTRLDLSHNPKLGYLYLSTNRLTALDVSNNPELKQLNVRNNKLTKLDLSQQTKLQEVKADYNTLDEFALGKNPQLRALEINNNQLSELDISQQSGLKKLIAFNNPLYDITFDHDHKFDLFSVEGTPYTAALTTTSQEPEKAQGISNLLAPRVSIIEGGVITQKGHQYEVTPTQMVAPSLGQYIGFRYSVTLPKNAQGKVDPSLAKTSQFPITVRMTHPEIVDPKTGKGFTVSTWTDTMFKHDQNLAMWYFGDKSELVSGRWVLEILYRDNVVARKAFQLINLDDPKEQQAIKQALVLQRLLTKGAGFLCANKSLQSCMHIESEAQCEQTLEPYNQECQAQAKAMIDKQKDSIKSKDALTEYSKLYIGCLAAKYVEVKQLDRQEVRACIKT